MDSPERNESGLEYLPRPYRCATRTYSSTSLVHVYALGYVQVYVLESIFEHTTMVVYVPWYHGMVTAFLSLFAASTTMVAS
jgi:hypothetical protein